MWIMTNKAFVSVVDKSNEAGCLLVRGRCRDHITAIFPKAKVRESIGTDYRYRADIPRSEVARAMAREVERIEYDNFKDSVRDDDYHDALMGVWSCMGKLQPGGPYGRGNRRARHSEFDLFD